MNAANLFFSFNGRISRKPFWLGLLAIGIVGTVLATVATVLAMGASEGSVPMGSVIVGLLTILLIYPVLAIYAKRWHDHDCTGWKALTMIQPIGGLWDLIEVAFFRGTAGPNRFGPDPLAGSGYTQPGYARPIAA
jgi:uncharacterized membrane protein YhaH (DUF805 family)